jgi:PAS domain S-box-containing protein
MDAPFDLLFQQAPDALIFADREGAIRLWNAGAERIFGYTAVEVVGGSLDVIIPERFREAHWRGFRRAIDAGDTKYAGRALTTRALHQEGRTLYVDLMFALIRDAGGAVIGVLATGRDSTESYLAQKALRERANPIDKQTSSK